MRVLVATDIAARGLDIDQLPQVVNFDLPNVPEDYVHRIGRTGRAGADGKAVSLVSDEEAKLLADIERLIGKLLPRAEVEGFEPTHTLPETNLTPKRHGQHKGPRNPKPKSNSQRSSNRSSNGQRSDKAGQPRRGDQAQGNKEGQGRRRTGASTGTSKPASEGQQAQNQGKQEHRDGNAPARRRRRRRPSQGTPKPATN